MSLKEVFLPVVVIGATGRVGHHVVDGLIRAGRQVRAVSRHGTDERPGVTSCRADVSDTEALQAVLAGAGAVFVSLPPTLQWRQLERIGADIAGAGVATTVLLSSALVDSYPNSVLAVGHQREELILHSAIGDSLVVLRPGMFMDNDAAEWADSIREQSAVFTAFPDALELPIAPVDIARAAVAALTATGRTEPRTQRLLGPAWLSPRTRAAVLADVLERPIRVEQISPDEHVAALARARPEPIARQKVMMLSRAPRSIAECPQLPLGTHRTRYSAWAAANSAAFRP